MFERDECFGEGLWGEENLCDDWWIGFNYVIDLVHKLLKTCKLHFFLQQNRNTMKHSEKTIFYEYIFPQLLPKVPISPNCDLTALVFFPLPQTQSRKPHWFRSKWLSRRQPLVMTNTRGLNEEGWAKTVLLIKSTSWIIKGTSVETRGCQGIKKIQKVPFFLGLRK